MSLLWGRSMLSLVCCYATRVVLGRKSENILPNKIVRQFLILGVLWIVSDFIHTRTTQDCDGPALVQTPFARSIWHHFRRRWPWSMVGEVGLGANVVSWIGNPVHRVHNLSNLQYFSENISQDRP